MNLSFFIAKKIISSGKSKRVGSKPIVKLAVLGISLGIAVMILTVAIVKGFQSEIRDKVIGFGSNIQITNYSTNNSYEPDPLNRNQKFISEIEQVEGIKNIQVYATKNGIIKTNDEIEGIVLKGVATDYDWSFLKKHLTEGKIPMLSDDSLSKDMLISQTVSKRLGIALDDKVYIYFITPKKGSTNSNDPLSYQQRVRVFNVCGIYNSGFEEFDGKHVFADIGHIRKLNYWNDEEVGGFEVSINDFNDLDVLGNKIDNIVGYEFNAQTVKQLNSTIFSWLDLQDMNAIIVIVLMIVVAAINMISTLLILILERTNMIGILKALGLRNGGLRKIFLFNALYIIGKGLLWGNIIGILIGFVQLQFGLFTLSQETYYMSVIPIKLNLLDIVGLNVLTVACCFLMLLLPSMVISRIMPIKAIRFS